MSTATPREVTAIEGVDWHTLDAADTATRLEVDVADGLDAAETAARLAEYGPNELADEPPPSVWVVARAQLANPMNIMLMIVCDRQLRHRADRHRRLRGRCW